MGSMSVLMLPESLRTKLGDEAARELVEVFNTVATGTHERTVEVLVERFERRLVEEIGRAKNDLVKFMFLFWLGGIVALIVSILLKD